MTTVIAQSADARSLGTEKGAQMTRTKRVALQAVVAAVAIVSPGTASVDGQERRQETGGSPDARVKLLRPTAAVLRRLERVTLPAQFPRRTLDPRLVSRGRVAVDAIPTPIDGVDMVVESCEVTCIALTTRAEVACPDGVDPLTMAPNLRWVTRNRGNQGASFYAADPGRMVFQVSSEISVGGSFGTIAPAEGLYIGPGESFSSSHTFFTYASTPGDDHRFVVEVDANEPCCDVDEADETNNVCEPTYRVVAASLPDPAITSVTIAPNPGASNAAFTAHVTVTNRGSANTAAGSLACTNFTGATLPSMAPGASATFDLPRSSAGSIPPGVKTITCEVVNHIGNTFWTHADSDVTNNQVTATYTVAN